jgi:hypothetical protein
MFQLVIAVYGYIMATGIGCFVLLFVVLFKRPVNSENKLCRSTNMLSPLPSSLHSMPDGTNGRLFGHRQGQNFVDGRPGDTTVDEQDDNDDELEGTFSSGNGSSRPCHFLMSLSAWWFSFGFFQLYSHPCHSSLVLPFAS